ncbi:unnamed protein product [Cylicocyclus nassatus]|uniref:Uncharacterized protein n=1 Tax=Cylicocyclus nassatus TaxID=53992 RepID=A0AA36M3H9_CYLNA|nr:unnamed protein product [Cylicocyclus nassatus]
MGDNFDVSKFLEAWVSVPVDEWSAKVDEWAHQFSEAKPRGRSNQVWRSGARSSQARLETSDKIEAQFCAVKPTDDGSVVEIISDNWVRFGLLMTHGIIIQRGLTARIVLHLDEKVSIRPKQRFAIRQGTTIIGRGVFTHLLPPQTEEEKKKVMETKTQKLENNPCKNAAEKQGEPGCSHSDNDKDHTSAKASKELENK